MYLKSSNIFHIKRYIKLHKILFWILVWIIDRLKLTLSLKIWPIHILDCTFISFGVLKANNTLIISKCNHKKG